MTSTDNEDDPAFVALPARLRRRIDNVFDSMVRTNETAGGFIIEESAAYEAGGFIVEDLPSTSPAAQSCIPLSEIPRALSFLDVVPDDDVMGVFKNAAAGWGVQDARNDGVSRKDWRAVCAALLEGEHDGGGDEETPNMDEDVEMDGDSGPDSDEYQMEELSSDSKGPSSDEYEEPGQAAGRAHRKTAAKSSGKDIPRQLTESQKVQCRQDFGRFFPDAPDDELDHQRIMIKDITRVADLLKENLKTEEILEMLEAFSTSPDKSMSLADFEHMMVLTKLV